MLQIPTSCKIAAVTAVGANENLQFADTPCESVIISADKTNTGNIFYGGVSGTTPDTTGICLTAGQASPLIFIDNLKKLSYKIVVSGEKIQVLVFK